MVLVDIPVKRRSQMDPQLTTTMLMIDAVIKGRRGVLGGQVELGRGGSGKFS